MKMLLALVLLGSSFASALDATSIDGTWTQTNRDDATQQQKTWHGGQWLVTCREIKSGEMTWWTGGNYRFEDGRYIEDIVFCSDPEWDQLGTTHEYAFAAKGNQLIQIWPDSDHREIYWRNAAPTSLPGDHVQDKRVPELAGAWVHLGQVGDQPRTLNGMARFGLDLQADGTFAWQLAKRPTIVKGAWNLTQESPASDLILHMRIDASGLGSKLIKGQVLRWRIELHDSKLSLVSLDGQDNDLYSRGLLRIKG